MRERIESWLRRRPKVIVIVVSAAAIFAAIVLPELLRATGIDRAAASAIRFGSIVAALVAFVAAMWFSSAPLRRLIADTRSSNELTQMAG